MAYRILQIRKKRRQHRIVSRCVGQIILNVRDFFIKEFFRNARIDVVQVTDRVLQATKMGRNIICKLNTQANVDNLLEFDTMEKHTRGMAVPV